MLTLVRAAVKQSASTATLLLTTRKSNNLVRHSLIVKFDHARMFSTIQLTKNLELHSKEKKSIQVHDLKLSRPQDKPLVILLSWMLAKPRHLANFIQYYTKYDIDVLKVTLTPWQLLWPAKGSQLIARDVLTFLDINVSYAPLFIHGFSVGGYQWGEVLVQMAGDPKRYKHITDKIVGQVWDSAADISEVSFGFPMAVFPKNLVLQNAMKQYLLYHMKAFEKVATCHYIRSSQLFHSDLVKAPVLFFVSKTDPVGAEASNQRLREDWERLGIKVYWKCWDKSPHVSHFLYHREEYIEQLEGFINELGLTSHHKKIQAKL